MKTCAHTHAKGGNTCFKKDLEIIVVLGSTFITSHFSLRCLCWGQKNPFSFFRPILHRTFIKGQVWSAPVRAEMHELHSILK